SWPGPTASAPTGSATATCLTRSARWSACRPSSKFWRLCRSVTLPARWAVARSSASPSVRWWPASASARPGPEGLRLARGRYLLSAGELDSDRGGSGLRQDIEFQAEGPRLRGWLYTPDAGGAPFPTVVMAHGFSAVKEMYLDRFAEAFAEVGL